MPKCLHGLLPTEVRIVRTCSAATDALTCGALQINSVVTDDESAEVQVPNSVKQRKLQLN